MTVCVIVQLAKQHGTELFETSAWTNQNIAEAFEALAEKILDSVSLVVPCMVPSAMNESLSVSLSLCRLRKRFRVIKFEVDSTVRCQLAMLVMGLLLLGLLAQGAGPAVALAQDNTLCL